MSSVSTANAESAKPKESTTPFAESATHGTTTGSTAAKGEPSTITEVIKEKYDVAVTYVTETYEANKPDATTLQQLHSHLYNIVLLVCSTVTLGFTIAITLYLFVTTLNELMEYTTSPAERLEAGLKPFTLSKKALISTASLCAFAYVGYVLNPVFDEKAAFGDRVTHGMKAGQLLQLFMLVVLGFVVAADMMMKDIAWWSRSDGKLTLSIGARKGIR